MRSHQTHSVVTHQTTSQKRRAALASSLQKSQSPLKSDHSVGSAKHSKPLGNGSSHRPTSRKQTLGHKSVTEPVSGKNSTTQKLHDYNKQEDIKLTAESFQDKKLQLDNEHQLKNQQLNNKHGETQVHSLFTTGAIAAFQKQQLSSGGQYSPQRSKHSAAMDSFAQYGDGPSSIATLQPHPFNVLISDFQQRRQINNMKKEASVSDFLNAFKTQIKELDTQYYQQKQQISEQLAAANKQQEGPQSDLCNNSKQQNNDSSSDFYSNLQPSVGNMGILSQLGLCQNQIPCQSVPLINEPYSSFEFVPNSLQFFYPKQVQRQLQKKKYQNNERIVQGLKAPINKASFQKSMEKMRTLGQCQMNFIRVVFQKIDRKSKPIKKQEKLVSENLKRKRIFLEEENFDILSVLHSSHSQAQKANDHSSKANSNSNNINGFSNITNPFSQQQQIISNGQNENIKETSKPISHRISDSISDIENRFNGHIDPLKNPSQIANMPSQSSNITKHSMMTSKSPMSTQKQQLETPITKKLALKKSQSVGISENLNLASHGASVDNLCNPTTIIIDSTTIQTPSKKQQKQTPMNAKCNQSQTKRSTASKKPKMATLQQNQYVQAYNKDNSSNGNLYMKILIPDGGNHNNSTSQDKTTEEDENQAVLMDNYGAILMQNQNMMIGQHRDSQDMDMEVDEDNIHHQHYIFGGQDDEDDDSEPHQNINQVRGFSGYLGLENQSHSEQPNRYNNYPQTTLHHRNLNNGQGNDLGITGGLYIDTYPKYNQPGSVSTNIGSDIHHELLINRLKPHCQRNLDFFDFPQELDHDQVFIADYQSRGIGNDHLQSVGHSNNPCITPKGQNKQNSFFMNSSSPHQMIADPPIFGGEFIGDEHMNWNSLVNQQEIVAHNSHDETYFNYDMRI